MELRPALTQHLDLGQGDDHLRIQEVHKVTLPSFEIVRLIGVGALMVSKASLEELDPLCPLHLFVGRTALDGAVQRFADEHFTVPFASDQVGDGETAGQVGIVGSR